MVGNNTRAIPLPPEPSMESKELRKAGLKVTLPRLKILEILEANQQRHMSAEDVYKHLLESDAEIGLATVYRVLTQFETAGLVRRHNFEGGSAVFELDDGGHHDHIICQQCGHVEEFVDATIEARQEAAAARPTASPSLTTRWSSTATARARIART
jgi:Fur family transcriptional regulator, ferric uptake regulator